PASALHTTTPPALLPAASAALQTAHSPLPAPAPATPRDRLYRYASAAFAPARQRLPAPCTQVTVLAGSDATRCHLHLLFQPRKQSIAVHRPHAPSPLLRSPTRVAAAPSRSRPARYVAHAASPGNRHGPGTPASHLLDNAPDRQSDKVVHRARHTDPE